MLAAAEEIFLCCSEKEQAQCNNNLQVCCLLSYGSDLLFPLLPSSSPPLPVPCSCQYDRSFFIAAIYMRNLADFSTQEVFIGFCRARKYQVLECYPL